MSTIPSFSAMVRRTLLHPTGGVAGLVGDLLTMCRIHGLQIDWQADHCQVRALGSDQEELIDVPLRKSVFRAILARMAALCNEQSPDSVSPFGGEGEISVGSSPRTLVRVIFANTPDAQRLELRCAPAVPRAIPIESGPSWETDLRKAPNS